MLWSSMLLTAVHGRYMVVLRLGGMYADMDTECVKPLNDLIEPRDTMLVGWENEFPNMDHARFRSYARERQVCRPGHSKQQHCVIHRSVCSQCQKPAELMAHHFGAVGSCPLSACSCCLGRLMPRLCNGFVRVSLASAQDCASPDLASSSRSSCLS